MLLFDLAWSFLAIASHSECFHPRQFFRIQTYVTYQYFHYCFISDIQTQHVPTLTMAFPLQICLFMVFASPVSSTATLHHYLGCILDTARMILACGARHESLIKNEHPGRKILQQLYFTTICIKNTFSARLTWRSQAGGYLGKEISQVSPDASWKMGVGWFLCGSVYSDEVYMFSGSHKSILIL